LAGKPDSSSRLRDGYGWLPFVAAWLFGATLLGVVVLFVLHTGDIETFLTTVRHADPSWLGVAVLCQVGTYICAAAVWHLAVRRSGAALAFTSLLRLAFIELFANQSVPTVGLSGNIMVMHGLTRRGVSSALAMTAQLDVGPGAAFASFILASIVATLSPLPLGLGTFEATCMALLHLLGGGLEASLAATLIFRGLILWLPMLPGLWLMRKEALPDGADWPRVFSSPQDDL
jgi:uncharacterized membrane protein YbhN (UPF0104 family)